MMKKLLIFFITIVLIILSLYFYMHRDRGRVLDKTRTVFINKTDNGFQLYRNGFPFYIKGASGTSYLKELADAGGNTLRVYDTLNLNVLLDEAQKYDIAIIIDIPLPTNEYNDTYYADEKTIQKVKSDIRKLVQRHKDHPSLLMWNLGNELYFPMIIKENKFIKVFNELVDIIHEEDRNHLVSTTIVGVSKRQTLSIHLYAPKVDIIGFNAFGNITGVKSLMKNIELITAPKPYFITEWGNHGPWEAPKNLWKSVLEPNSTAKGEIYRAIYLNHIEQNKDCLGSLAFYWGYKHEGTPTWFNLFDEEGRKSEVYYQLKSLWTENQLADTTIPKIEKLILNDLEKNYQIFDSNSTLDVQVNLQDSIDSNVSFHWKIYKEAWGNHEWISETDALQISYSNTTFSNKMKFHAPKDDGPYRVVVSVHDLQGNFATANMPFYVLNHEM